MEVVFFPFQRGKFCGVCVAEGRGGERGKGGLGLCVCLLKGKGGNQQVVAVTNTSLAEAMRIDEACRKQGIPFIRADTRGVFASLFCDFGASFTVFDTDGESPSLFVGIHPLMVSHPHCLWAFKSGHSRVE